MIANMAFQKRSVGDLLQVTAVLMTKRRCDRWSFGGRGERGGQHRCTFDKGSQTSGISSEQIVCVRQG